MNEPTNTPPLVKRRCGECHWYERVKKDAQCGYCHGGVPAAHPSGFPCLRPIVGEHDFSCPVFREAYKPEEATSAEVKANGVPVARTAVKNGWAAVVGTAVGSVPKHKKAGR